MIEGLRGEESIASLCRREGIVANLYTRWSKEFLEAGKRRLLGDTQREASSSEVHDLRKENARLKELVAETVLENRSAQKKRDGLRCARGRGVRVSASEKLELIRLVEGSSLSIRRTLTEIRAAALDVFRLVQALPGRRTRGARRPQATLPVRLEPDPGADSGAGEITREWHRSC